MNKLLYGLYYDASYLIHGNDLAIASPGGTTLDTEGRPLTGLTHAGKCWTTHVRSERLGETDCSGRFALTKRGRRDTEHSAVRYILLK